MPLVPWMWALWAALVLLFLALKIYVARLSRDEDDQIVLDESFEHVREEQAVIVARINRVQPLVRVVLVLLAAMTFFVAAYYIRDMILQFQ